MARVIDIDSIPRVRIPILGGRFKRIVLLTIPALVVFIIIYATFTTYLRPNELGVRQVFIDVPFGPDKGIQPEIYGPGLYFIMPGYERLHKFPRDIQVIELNDAQGEGSALASHAPSIRIQTSEGYQVTVDVTVEYRVVDPYKVITSVGPGRLYETQLVLPRADRFLRQYLGQLNAEEFYIGPTRIAKAQETRKQLSDDLEDDGIAVWNLMVRHFSYDERYQAAIEQRKIQDQTVFKNRAEARAASEEAEKNRVVAMGAASVTVEAERGASEVRVIQADGDLYYRQKIAEGDKLLALAEARATQLRNEALQAAGAANVVGLEMAEVLEGTKVVIIPTDGPRASNPLDLDNLLKGW